MKSLEEIHAGFRDQALSPEDSNWPKNIHTQHLESFLETHFGCDKAFNILDIGSGKARVSETLKPSFPSAQFTGIDFVQESLDVAIKKGRIDRSICLDLSKPYNEEPLDTFDIAFSTRSMFFLTPDEIKNALKIVSAHLKPNAPFLCQFFFKTDEHTDDFIEAFKTIKPQYRSLEALKTIYGLYGESDFTVDKALSNQSILQKPDEHFPTVLIYSHKENK